jgi:hypothetical protein
MTTIDDNGYIEYDYEDLCTECKMHDKCHENSIDYDEIDKCCQELNSQMKARGTKLYKTPEPKEKVLFT